MSHRLDRPVWNAFAGRQAALAVRNGTAVRVDPQIGPFGATADLSPASFADLVPLVDPDGLALVETEGTTLSIPPGLVVAREMALHQMVAVRAMPASAEIDHRPLGPADAPAMLALATLTKPGPFRLRTPDFGGFIGIEQEGRLVAMAGERMRPAGFTEISAVCTHPDARGRGLAAGLMRAVAARIVGRGEVPFLHTHSTNHGAIALYERPGFELRRVMTLTVVVPAA